MTWKNLLAVTAAMLLTAGCTSGDNSGTGNRAVESESGGSKTRISHLDARSASSSRSASRGPASRNNYAAKASKPAEPEVQFTGSVTLPKGAPAADATVTLWTCPDDTNTTLPWQRATEIKTDAKGMFDLTASPSENYNVTANKPGFAVVAEFFDAGDAQGGRTSVFPPVHLRLKPEAPFSGHVVGPDGEPLRGAHVLASSIDGSGITVSEIQAYTDEQGSFTLNRLPAAGVNVAVKPPAGALEFHTATAPDADVQLKLSGKAPNIDGALISDNVDLKQTTATVTLQGSSKITGLNMKYQAIFPADSRFDFGIVPPQNYTVYISGDPVNIFPVTESYQSGTPVTGINVKDGKSTTTEIKVTAGKTMRGLIVDADTSSPLSGVRIYRDYKSSKEDRDYAMSGPDGSFTLTGVYRVQSVQFNSDSHHLVEPVNQHKQFEADPDALSTITVVMAASPFIRGRVVSAAGGPVAGATLEVYTGPLMNDSSETVPVETGGTFQYQAVPGKSYTFIAKAQGVAAAVSDEITVSGEDINGVQLRLGRGRRLSGVVVDSAGKPVAGAQIKAGIPNWTVSMVISYNPIYDYNNIAEEMANTASDEQGRFELNLLPVNSNFMLSAEAPGYAHPVYYFANKGNEDITDVRLQLPATMQLTGTVINEDEEPVAGVELSMRANLTQVFYRTSTITSTSGTFELKNIPQTDIATFTAEHEDYSEFSKNVNITDEPVSITLTRIHGTEVLVRCLDISTREPVKAELKIIDASSHATPEVTPAGDEPGLYKISPVELGNSYIITAAAEGYIPTSYYDTISDAEETIELRLRQQCTIHGRVVDATDKTPVAGAEIALRHGQNSVATTDADGRFEFEPEHTGATYIAKKTDSQLSYPFTPQVTSGEEIDVGDIELYSKVPLTVRVVRGGDPVPDVQVEVDSRSSDKVAGKTDKRGELHTSALRPDQYITISLPELNYSRNVDSAGSSEKDWVITCHVGGGELFGRLLLDDEPVAGSITGRHVETVGTSVKTSIGSDGRFDMKDLASGRWKFNAHSHSYHISSGEIDITIPADGDPIERDIHLGGSRVKGRVVNQAGEPVADATVRLEATGSGSSYGNSSGVNGEFEYSTPVPPGSYIAQANHETQGRTDSISYQVPQSGDAPLLNLTLRLTPSRITCTVLSILDGLPVATGATAKLMSGSEMVASGTNAGKSASDVVITNVAPGDYQLVISAHGYSEATRNIKMEEGQSLSFTDVLSPAANIIVQVLDQTGYVVPGAVVTVTPTDTAAIESPRTATTDETGTAKFNGMLYGTYQLQSTTPTGATGSGSVSTLNQASTSYRLVVHP